MYHLPVRVRTRRSDVYTVRMLQSESESEVTASVMCPYGNRKGKHCAGSRPVQASFTCVTHNLMMYSVMQVTIYSAPDIRP